VAAYNKFNLFTQELVRGEHRLQSDVMNFMLTNTAPTAANAVYADVSGTELANGNGYTTGGAASALTLSNASGVEKVVAAQTVFTATGSMGPFRYVIWYNITQTTPLKPLIGWADYGSSITLAATETFTITPDASNGLFTIT
jgi:hypothetical protein